MVNAMTEPILQNPIDAIPSLESRFRRGDEGVFDEVIMQYLPSIRSLVHRLLGFAGEVDDVVQDVFIAAMTRRKTFRADAMLKSWLYAIAVNHCRTYNRRRKLCQTFLRQHDHRPGLAAASPPVVSLQREQAARIQRAVRQLPDKYRGVIVLKYLEELPTEQILTILNINDKTFYTRLNRARQQLKQSLSDFMEPSDE